jgi:hypothetical protein
VLTLSRFACSCIRCGKACHLRCFNTFIKRIHARISALLNKCE